MKTISNWLLGGALAASLTWNWKLYSGLDGPPSGERCIESCTSGLDLEFIEGSEKKQALDTMCQRSCRDSDRLERKADELQHELLASLSAETVDQAAADALVSEISDLRRRSLATCVEGILGVRSVLSGDEVRALLERCEHTSCK